MKVPFFFAWQRFFLRVFFALLIVQYAFAHPTVCFCSSYSMLLLIVQYAFWPCYLTPFCSLNSLLFEPILKAEHNPFSGKNKMPAVTRLTGRNDSVKALGRSVLQSQTGESIWTVALGSRFCAAQVSKMRCIFASLISTDVQKMSWQTAHIALPVLLPDDHLKFYKFALSKSVVSSEKIRFVAISTCQIRFGSTMRVRAAPNW